MSAHLLSLKGKLVVSCQADELDAFFGAMDRFAAAAVAGGAAGIRANGARDIRAIRQAVTVPIIGIHKEIYSDGRILITPSFEAAQELVHAGADLVALDCTKRGQQSGAFERLQRIKEKLKVPVLADIATIEEAISAWRAGADVILSTMRGYTDDTSGIRQFEPGFIRELTRVTPLAVIAEGRIDTPALAQEAIRAGAHCVVVGTAITRPHQVTKWFAKAAEAAATPLPHSTAILAIDMGGTNTKFGLVSPDGSLLRQQTLATPAKEGRRALVEHLKRIGRMGLHHCKEIQCEPLALGLATAGWVDPKSGRVVYATENLPEWTGTPIGELLREETGLRVCVENDANALAVGEHRFGAAQSWNNFVCITLGTGLGGGCFIDGKLQHGAHYFANALGHIVIERNGRPCNCGQSGCLETYTNAAALLADGEGAYTSCEALVAAANKGEPIAEKAVRRLAGHLANGCAVILQLLDPEGLILAGGLADQNPLLISALKSELANQTSVWEQRNLQIATSRLGYHAGVLGAAALTLQG